MPVSKKKPTTLTSEGSTQESSSPVLPEQEDFRQYLRRLASAIQVLIEQVMCEELDESHRNLLGRMYAQSPWVSQWVLHPRFSDSHRAY
jgi:hypothetical protein